MNVTIIVLKYDLDLAEPHSHRMILVLIIVKPLPKIFRFQEVIDASTTDYLLRWLPQLIGFSLLKMAKPL